MRKHTRLEQKRSDGAPNALADTCAQAVMETVPPVMQAIREETRRHGAPPFSIPQFRTLAFLHRHPRACLFHLAAHLGVSRPTASALVDRLVAQGIVTRATDPRERRRILLTLTPRGARRFQQASRSAQIWMTSVLARLSPDALRRIALGMNLLDEVFRELGRDNGRPGASPLPCRSRARADTQEPVTGRIE